MQDGQTHADHHVGRGLSRCLLVIGCTLIAPSFALAQIPGLYVAGNAYQGIGIPDCIRMGKAAAEKILSASSHR